ncbi:MAG: HAD hydrolase-like protein [Candidatus Daviesbacteria bacterium]|nr:HAD hydrolase-like protein [Candidatus Daviesbacteria bacterium]
MKNANTSSFKFKIPLFDIDWTLLKGGNVGNKVHHDAFEFALHTVYNQSAASYADASGQGRIDTQILIQILNVHGVSEEEAKNKMPQALEAMAKYFMKHADEGTYEIMPGVVELLADLKKRGLTLGLLTGNVAEIGWEKLRRAGIKDYFSFGAFGSMAYRRVDLIDIARKEAEKVLGQKLSVHDFVIVGDSPLDIACARAGGIPVIAVGTGHYKPHELIHADLTLESLEEKDKILEFLGLQGENI